jgi:hypothetical protein
VDAPVELIPGVSLGFGVDNIIDFIPVGSLGSGVQRPHRRERNRRFSVPGPIED